MDLSSLFEGVQQLEPSSSEYLSCLECGLGIIYCVCFNSGPKTAIENTQGGPDAETDAAGGGGGAGVNNVGVVQSHEEIYNLLTTPTMMTSSQDTNNNNNNNNNNNRSTPPPSTLLNMEASRATIVNGNHDINGENNGPDVAQAQLKHGQGKPLSMFSIHQNELLEMDHKRQQQEKTEKG